MTPSLPQLLTTTDLPHAELQAAALDGDVFRIDRAFCSVAEFDVPWRRASVFGASSTLVIAGRSAAWVWGALPHAPVAHEAFRVAGGKNVTGPSGFRVRTVAVDPADRVAFSGVLVTSPSRTVVDLCRGDGFDDETAEAVRCLVDSHRVTRAGCDVVLERERSVPYRRRARSRLDAVGLLVPSPEADAARVRPSGAG